MYETSYPGFVSFYEEREAARFNMYRFADWLELPHEERAICVAFFRMNHLVSLHRNDAQVTENQRQQKRHARRNGGS